MRGLVFGLYLSVLALDLLLCAQKFKIRGMRKAQMTGISFPLWKKSANGDRSEWPWVEKFVSFLFDRGNDVAVCREIGRESNQEQSSFRLSDQTHEVTVRGQNGDLRLVSLM